MRKRIIVTGEGDDIDLFRQEGENAYLEKIEEGKTIANLDIVTIGDVEAYEKVGGPEIQQLEYEPDPEPIDPEPLTDLDKLRSRVNEIENHFDRRLDETKAHYEGLLKAANGSDLNKLRYQLDGLEKTFNSLGPISLNQVKEIAKFEVNAALGCYPPEMAGFIQSMREWALKVQKDLEGRLNTFHFTEADEHLLDRVKELEAIVEMDHKLLFSGDLGLGIRVENLENQPIYPAIAKQIEDLKIWKNDHKAFHAVLQGKVLKLEDLLKNWRPGPTYSDLGAVQKNIEKGTIEILTRINTVEDRTKTINDLIRPMERIKDTGAKIAMVEEDDLPDLVAFARDWKGGKLKAELDDLRKIVTGHAEHDFSAIHEEAQKQWTEINSLIKGLQTTDRTIHTLVGQINRLEENTGPEIAGTEEEVEGQRLKIYSSKNMTIPPEIEAILGRFGKIEEKTQYIFDELHPNDPGRAGGVVQDLYALQRTDYKNLTKRVDACMKEINGHGHTEFTEMREDVRNLKMTDEALEKGQDELEKRIKPLEADALHLKSLPTSMKPKKK